MKRGLRNNNPLNIRHSADRWQGAKTKQTDPSFVQFESMAYGYRAAWKVLDTYWKRFEQEQRAYNVRNIIARWAPPDENDTESYIRTVTRLSGLGGNENVPRPLRFWCFGELEKTARLLAAMTCVECGISMDKVDMNAIWEGYDLAFPAAKRRQVTRNSTLRPTRPLMVEPRPIPQPLDQVFHHWDEYWEWSPQAYTN